MKTIHGKNLIIICALVIVITFVGYFFISIPDKSNIVDTSLPPKLPDDEMIIVSEPEIEKKDENFVDKLFDIFGLVSIEDDEVPLASSSINASDVGMIPNDKSKALHNANLLIKTLNANSRIVIDDKYYVTTPSEPLSTEEVEITGIADAEIIADSDYSSKLFDPALLKSITIRNVRFTNLNSTSSFLVVYSGKKTDNKVDRVDIQDCTFTGNISLYRQYGNTDIDPDQTDFGVGNFLFKNNTVSNTNFSFIVLVDIPVRSCEIISNSISNFSYKFISISITNEIPYDHKLYNRISYLKVDDNKVICDDDWWGESSSGSYYTFVLFEGDEVLYNNNHVEGLKALNDIAVYDAYFNARVVNYANNTWKNNICFASGKVNNTLLKSKGGGVKPLIRNYTGNRFIVEEDFAERVGQPKDNLYVYFMSLTQYAETYNIRDNLFDIYDLRFPASSLLIGNFSFSGNIVKAVKSSGNLAIVRVNDGYDVFSINISDNTIELGAEGNNTFNLITMINANSGIKSSIKRINVTNNKIKAHFGYLLFGVVTDDITFRDNTIEDTGNEYSGFAFNSRFVKSNIANNSIVSRNSVTFYEGRQYYGEGVKREALRIVSNNYADGNNGMHLDLKYNSETPTTYKRTYSFTTPEGAYEFYYTFTLKYNSANKCAEVTFSNNKGEVETYKLGDGDTSLNGSGQFIQLISLNSSTGQIPLKVRFYNSKEKACFYINEYNSNFSELNIETISYESNDRSNG